jgi:hypothetical protein
MMRFLNKPPISLPAVPRHIATYNEQQHEYSTFNPELSQCSTPLGSGATYVFPFGHSKFLPYSVTNLAILDRPDEPGNPSRFLRSFSNTSSSFWPTALAPVPLNHHFANKLWSFSGSAAMLREFLMHVGFGHIERFEPTSRHAGEQTFLLPRCRIPD